MDTLVHAAPRSVVLPFLEEGDAVKSTLAAIVGIPADVQSDIAFSDELRKAYTANPDRVLARAHVAPEPTRETTVKAEGHLSQREIDILAFVSQGLQNKEIGERLGLAEGSVKWYMQQIYMKLGVRRRLKAFQKAKALGLIR